MKAKKAIVTGGTVGIGFAIARGLAAQGVTITIANLNEDAARKAAEALPGTHYAQAIDVRERSSVANAFSAAIKEMGGLDILIANAGVSTMRPGIDLTDEDWDFNMNVNAREYERQRSWLFSLKSMFCVALS